MHNLVKYYNSAAVNWFVANYNEIKKVTKDSTFCYLNEEDARRQMYKDYYDVKNLINFLNTHKVCNREALIILGAAKGIMEVYCREYNFIAELENNTLGLLKDESFVNNLSKYKLTLITIKLEESLYLLKSALKRYDTINNWESKRQMLNICSFICLSIMIGM